MISLQKQAVYMERRMAGRDPPGLRVCVPSCCECELSCPPSAGRDKAEDATVLDYDYYGAYSHTPRRKLYGYEKWLEQDYTFTWPKCHDNIGTEHK